LLQTKLFELGHPNSQIKFIKADAPPDRRVAQPEAAHATLAQKGSPPRSAGPARSAAPAPTMKEKLAPVPFNKEDFKNDPLIQKALEIFKGQIVEVRA
jgi:hypothetical protein